MHDYFCLQATEIFLTTKQLSQNISICRQELSFKPSHIKLIYKRQYIYSSSFSYKSIDALRFFFCIFFILKINIKKWCGNLCPQKKIFRVKFNNIVNTKMDGGIERWIREMAIVNHLSSSSAGGGILGQNWSFLHFFNF